MENKTQTINQLKNFTIMEGSEDVTDQYLPPEPGALEVAGAAVLNGIGRAVDHVKLETRMLVFDALHKTNYRQIRHDLIEQKRREKFEASIGLVAIGKHQ